MPRRSGTTRPGTGHRQGTRVSYQVFVPLLSKSNRSDGPAMTDTRGHSTGVCVADALLPHRIVIKRARVLASAGYYPSPAAKETDERIDDIDDGRE